MKNAHWITHRDYQTIPGTLTWNINYYNSRELPLEPGAGLLNIRKCFRVSSSVASVTLRATALGIFRLYINGKRVGVEQDGRTVYDELKPGWTDYRVRVFGYEYDITSLCREENCFVADVAPGWWGGRISFGMYGWKPCAFIGEIEICYRDGRTELLSSDESWEAMIGGPTRRAEIWEGQYDDATLPHPAAEPNAYTWDTAIRFDGFDGQIVPPVGEPVRVREALNLRSCHATVYEGTVPNGSDMGEIRVVCQNDGESCEKLVLKAGQSLLLDMGQEAVGRPVLTFTAERGTKLEVFFAEMLNDSGEKSRGNDGPKGSAYLANYRTALSRYVCIASGETEETHAPSHTFFGFRYFEIRADRDVEISSVTAEILGSDLTETGTFVCDHPEVNRLYSNIVWGMRGNYLSIPTDCPQRDERLGWTGDTQIFCGAASYLADIRGFMHKWLGDARDSQIGYEGAYCDVIPRVFHHAEGGANAAWGDAGLIVPYRLLLMYNDRALIAEHYASMEWYMKHLERFGLSGPRPTYGDWLNYDVTDKAYLSVCYYAYDAKLMALFSQILGKEDRVRYYSDLRERILAHWRQTYLPDGTLTIRTQTAYLLPLAFDMVSEVERSVFIEALRCLIVENHYTLSTGFVGTGLLNQTLAKVGLHDLCYSLLLQTNDPSWLYSVRQGATTVWERWNSYTLANGFGDVSMNSFNHYAYGAVAEWFYAGIGGISPDPEHPGFEHFLLAPTPDRRTVLPEGQTLIGYAKATYRSIAGTIESEWKKEGDVFRYGFVIPEGTEAEIRLLTTADTVILNGETMTAKRLGAKRLDNRLVFSLPAGCYTVIAP